VKPLLITDLDNTLYDWVTFFARSFRALSGRAAELLQVQESQLLDEFRTFNQAAGTVEHPFALLDLPIVQERFAGVSRSGLRDALAGAFEAFVAERSATLALYPGVRETLTNLREAGIRIVAHTEASEANAYYRLQLLGVAALIDRVYVLESRPVDHPDAARQEELRPPPDRVVTIPRYQRKPNPAVLLGICQREAADVSETAYVGDSLSRDIYMASTAGMTSVWARYGTVYDPSDWETIVRVTHWTKADVARDADLRAESSHVRPDFVIESFSEIEQILQLASSPSEAARFSA
jgi:FMN phosphatase YigB (HAD superfamily)